MYTYMYTYRYLVNTHGNTHLMQFDTPAQDEHKKFSHLTYRVAKTHRTSQFVRHFQLIRHKAEGSFAGNHQ